MKNKTQFMPSLVLKSSLVLCIAVGAVLAMPPTSFAGPLDSSSQSSGSYANFQALQSSLSNGTTKSPKPSISKIYPSPVDQSKMTTDSNGNYFVYVYGANIQSTTRLFYLFSVTNPIS